MAEGIVLLNANKRRDWKSMDDKEVLEFARRFIEEKGIGSPVGVENADSGLYNILVRRKLLDKVEFEDRRGHREWGTDAEVLEVARRLVEWKEIRNPQGLKNADGELYLVLYRRKLLDKVEFEERKRKWGTDEEVLKIARRFIEEKGVKNRKGLEKADKGLYKILVRRKLLDKVEFENRQREWGTDEEVLDFARRLIEDKGIRNRKGLAKADTGLYQVLYTRGLLDQVFAPIDHAKHKAAVQGVLDAMDSFGDDR